MLGVVQLVGHKRDHRRARLELTVVAVIDLHARSGINRRERVWHGAQLGREFLVRQAGDDQLAVDERHVGDRLHARVPLACRGRRRRVRQRRLRHLEAVERHHLELAGAIDADQRRFGFGARSAHDRDVGILRFRVHGEVGNLHLLRIRAEHRSDLGVDARHIFRPGCAASRLGAEVYREDRRCLTIGGEQDTVRTERQRANRLQRLWCRRLRRVGRHRPGRGRRGSAKRRHRQRQRPCFQ